MTVGRVSQAAVEALSQAVAAARLGQHAAEILLVPASKVRLGQQTIEVLQSTELSSGALVRSPLFIICICG